MKVFVILFLINGICIYANPIFVLSDTNKTLKRKYYKVGGFQHVYKDELKIKWRSNYKIRHTSSQFRPLIIKGEYQVNGDTLIFNEKNIYRKVDLFRKKNEENNLNQKKYLINEDGLYLIYDRNSIREGYKLNPVHYHKTLKKAKDYYKSL